MSNVPKNRQSQCAKMSNVPKISQTCLKSVKACRSDKILLYLSKYDSVRIVPKFKPSSAYDEFNVSSGGGVLTFR